MEWISVNDRMPYFEGVYIVRVNGKVQTAAREDFLFRTIWNSGGFIMDVGFCPIEDEEVTHWMPMQFLDSSD